MDSQGGSLYVADGPTVRRIAANDQLTTPAGSGVGAGAADSGGLATFYGVPMTAGNIGTVSGTGITGFSGDGGPGVHADLDFPAGMAATGKGLLIVDNRRVRMISG